MYVIDSSREFYIILDEAMGRDVCSCRLKSLTWLQNVKMPLEFELNLYSVIKKEKKKQWQSSCLSMQISAMQPFIDYM